MKNLLIKNAAVVFPDSIKHSCNVLTLNGKISDCDFRGDPPENTEIINAEGNYLLPGFIDIHIHGGGGADFMDATPEAFETSVKSHLQHGTTTLVPTAMSAAEKNLTAFLKAFKSFRKNSKYGALTPGVHLEGPYFSGASAKSGGAQPRDILRLPDMDEVERLLKTADGDILRWDAAPELPGADEFARCMTDNGILCAIAHSNADSEEAQRGIDCGFSHVTHFYNAVTTYHKTGQTVYGGIVEAAYLNSGVTVELICDGKHIPRDILRLALKIKGVNSVAAITDAMRISGTDMKFGKLGSLKNGTDVIADDGVAKLPDMSSFAGSIATMDRCLKVLCLDYGISLTDASVMLSGTPARLSRLGSTKGRIQNGMDADMVLVNREMAVMYVISNGKAVK